MVTVVLFFHACETAGEAGELPSTTLASWWEYEHVIGTWEVVSSLVAGGPHRLH